MEKKFIEKYQTQVEDRNTRKKTNKKINKQKTENNGDTDIDQPGKKKIM